LTLVGHAGTVKSVAFRPDGTMLAAVGIDGSVVLWNLETQQGDPFLTLGPEQVRCTAFSPDNRVVATSSRTEVVALHDLATGRSRTLRDASQGSTGAASLAFSPDGTTLAVGQQDGRITLWDIVTGGVQTTLEGHEDFVASLAFSPDGAILASSGGDRAMRLWNLATGQAVSLSHGGANTVVALGFSPDSRLLALGDQVSPVVRLWDVSGGCERAVLHGPEGSVVDAAISPDGRTLAAADLHGLVTFWNLVTLELWPARFRHAGIHSLAFAPDGRTLASGGFDGTVHIWDWPPPPTLCHQIKSVICDPSR
jgi:WD40 repeat protein